MESHSLTLDAACAPKSPSLFDSQSGDETYARTSRRLPH